MAVDFSIYKLAKDIWPCVHENSNHYFNLGGKSAFCDDSDLDGNDKLIYKFLDAARTGVNVRVLYHNPGSGSYAGLYKSDEIWSYLKGLNRPANFQIHRADWDSGSTGGQMHNKFLLASHTLSAEGCVARESSFVTTANVDYFKADGVQNHHDWYQSGVLVKENKKLRAAYTNYFEVLWAHTVSPGDASFGRDLATGTKRHNDFIEHMQQNDLNWKSSDGKLQAWFYPVPDQVWDEDRNAVAHFVTRMANDPRTSGTRHVQVNMYHLKGGDFVRALFSALAEPHATELYARVAYSTDTASKGSSTIFKEGGLDDVEGGDIAIQKLTRKTHCKNYNFDYTNADGEREYVTITGSTNGKDDAYETKVNSQLVIVEGTGGKAYQAHWDMAERVFP